VFGIGAARLLVDAAVDVGYGLLAALLAPPLAGLGALGTRDSDASPLLIGATRSRAALVPVA
jgi:hypothetical protein